MGFRALCSLGLHGVQGFMGSRDRVWRFIGFRGLLGLEVYWV